MWLSETFKCIHWGFCETGYFLSGMCYASKERSYKFPGVRGAIMCADFRLILEHALKGESTVFVLCTYF